MAPTWTDEQWEVIRTRDRNLLVSAAAGAGKTAVLVERILSRVTDKTNPIDIDRLLVVTFTKAAAGEMKDRIARALEDRLAEDPDNAHLQRQAVLIDRARISTIDGFCTSVLQDYFYKIDLDPSYRIAEDDELKLLRKNAIDELLEEEYQKATGSDAFSLFMQAFGNRKNDASIEELLIRIDAFASSHPDPDAWMARALEAYTPQTEEELEQTGWMRFLETEAADEIQSLIETCRQIIRYIQRTPAAPQAYLAAFEADAAGLEAIGKPESYSAWGEALSAFVPAKLSNKKEEDEDPDLRKVIRTLRDKEIKGPLDKLKKEVFGLPVEMVLEELRIMRPYAEELLYLVRRFREVFAAAKRAQNLLDFSDLEHLALQILAEPNDAGGYDPTDVAKELAERFEEVMIDEYQDSNFLQEAILKSVSHGACGRQNRFMVGDMKQSIYGFRQARPDLFLQKYLDYSEHENAGTRIDLHKNFRSRPEVLSAVNQVFTKIMREELGGIRYDETVALYAEADYPPHPDPRAPETELYVIDKKAEAFQDSFGKETRIDAEAQLVADQIRELVHSGQVWDAQNKVYRPVEYRDCVVLLRSETGWGDRFVHVLQEEGIPAYSTAGKGFFSAQEITTILQYLKLCDNPDQDIPLAAILRSPIVGLSETEMAEIRAAAPQGTWPEAVAAARDGGVSETVQKKLAVFFEGLSVYRKRAHYTPIHQLLREILAETGYGDYAAAMPAGRQRQANLQMLIERAAQYEQRRDHSLFSFVRYIEELIQNKIDFGEVNLYGEEENIVRIMTIHKSKGLEFPIVFLAGIGKAANKEDERRPVVMQERFGIGMAAYYPAQHRMHRNTLLRTAIRHEIRRDAVAEEMRILYVGMTRAKEKLILIGAGEEAAESFRNQPTYGQILRAGNYLDWIRMAQGEGSVIREHWIGEEALALHTIREDLYSDAVQHEIRQLLQEASPGSFSEEVKKQLEEQDAFRYDRDGLDRLPAKLTVSELKHAAGGFAADEWGKELYPEKGGDPQEVLSGAARGTAYHHVFATLDLTAFGEETLSEEEIRSRMDQMQQDGILSEEERQAVQEKDIRLFLQSPLGKRMQDAAKQNRLWREQPFVLDVPAAEVWMSEEEAPQETILIQGTIDAYWKEQDGFILLDYKTDRIGEGGEQVLIDRYRIQLEYYKKALEQITEIPVKELWIYSVTLGKAIPL